MTLPDFNTVQEIEDWGGSYVYIYFLPKKRQPFTAKGVKLEYQPLYVGKGCGYRWRAGNHPALRRYVHANKPTLGLHISACLDRYHAELTEAYVINRFYDVLINKARPQDPVIDFGLPDNTLTLAPIDARDLSWIDKTPEESRACRPLTNEEMELVAKTFGGRYAARDKALFVLGVSTGFRISELLSLRILDVVRDDRIVYRIEVTRRQVKRTTMLPEAARAALELWLGQLYHLGYMTADCFLFQSREGSNKPITPQHAWAILKEAYQANELTGHLATHSMRKTYAKGVTP